MEPKDLIKQQILKAGLALMNQFGYGGLSLSALARQAKITKQRLYYHFPSTEDVLIVLAEDWSRTGQTCTMEALAQTHEVGAFKVFAMSKGMFQWMKDYSELSRLGLVIFQTSPHLKKLQHFMEGARNAARARIKSLLIQEKAFAALGEADLDQVITAIHSLLYGFFFYVITMNDFDNLEVHEHNCNEALRKLIESYAK